MVVLNLSDYSQKAQLLCSAWDMFFLHPLLIHPSLYFFSATKYGVGTYFAVNASYSANPMYSCPEADGTQLMFVARVLTGMYTVGTEDMRVPPAVSPQQPDVRFNSLVDNQQNPNMFVVFHDSQAYPDYLITFQ